MIPLQSNTTAFASKPALLQIHFFFYNYGSEPESPKYMAVHQ